MFSILVELAHVLSSKPPSPQDVELGYADTPQEGHDFTVDDIGEAISVGSTELTLLNVIGNEVDISAPYLGEDVLEG